MIDASNSLVTMQLIEGSNQMDYILLVLDIDVYSSSQIILAYH
jgi:hypothetical protein